MPKGGMQGLESLLLGVLHGQEIDDRKGAAHAEILESDCASLL